MSEVRIRVDNVIREYMDDGDVAKENANTSRSPSGLLLAVGGKGLKSHNLNELKKAGFERLVDLHNRGGIHIHDLTLGKYVAYCASHSLSNLLNDGIDSSIHSSPAKHISSAINHIINYIGTCANDFAGAQAFNDVDLYLAPYAYKAYLDYKKQGCSRNIAFRLARRDIYQNIQSLIYHLNYNSRWGSQSPFSNISLAITVPDDMKDQLALVAGKPLAEFYDYTKDGVRVNNTTYEDLWEWQRLVAEAILDVLIEGDADGKSFTFPVLTLQVSEGFFEHPLIDRICELTAKFGYPFFENHINGISGGKKTKQGDTRSMCPLHSSTKVHVKINGEVQTKCLEDIYGLENIQVLHAGNWYPATMVKVLPQECRTFITDNDVNITMDGRHEQLIRRDGEEKLILAKDIQVGDEFPFDIVIPTEAGGTSQRRLRGIYSWQKVSCIYPYLQAMNEYFYCFQVDSSERLFTLENGLVTHNCRLNLDLEEVAKHTGGLFGGADNTGSIQVVTLCLPYLAKKAKEEGHDFFELIADLMDEVKDEHLWKREIVEKQFEDGFYHLAKQNFSKGFKTFFSTFGFIGLWEAVQILNDDEQSFLTEEGMELAQEIMQFMSDRCNKYMQETGVLFNSEAVPAESCVTGDTLIKTVEYGDAQIQDLVGKTFGVWTLDENTNKCKIKKAYNVCKTRKDAKLLKICFDNGTNIKCTPDHRIALRYDCGRNQGKSVVKWVQAKDLQIGDSIKSLNMSKKIKNENRRLKNSGVPRNRKEKNHKVASIEVLDQTEDVYNMQVEDTESFFADDGKGRGVLLHNCSYKLAKKSLKEYPDIPHRGLKKAPYFTNSHHLPVEYQDQLDLVFTTQSKLQTIPTGGTVQHFQVGEELSVSEVKTAIHTICQTPISYFSINVHFAWCPIHGVFPGKHETCPYEHSEEDIAWLRQNYPSYVLDGDVAC